MSRAINDKIYLRPQLNDTLKKHALLSSNRACLLTKQDEQGQWHFGKKFHEGHAIFFRDTSLAVPMESLLLTIPVTADKERTLG